MYQIYAVKKRDGTIITSTQTQTKTETLRLFCKEFIDDSEDKLKTWLQYRRQGFRIIKIEQPKLF